MKWNGNNVDEPVYRRSVGRPGDVSGHPRFLTHTWMAGSNLREVLCGIFSRKISGSGKRILG